MVGIEWQHCEKFKPANECATALEKEEFFKNIRVRLEMVENYINFAERDTEDAIQSKKVDLLKVNSASEDDKHVKGVVELSAYTAKF